MSFTASLSDIVEEDRTGLLGAPDGWPRFRLGDLAEIKNGIALPSSGFNEEEGHPVVRIRNIVPGTTDTLFKGSVEDDWFIERGDLLIGMDGDFNCALWPGPRALLNQRVCRVRPLDERLSLKYLTYVLPGYLKAVNNHTSSITVKHLSSRTIAALPIPVPAPRVQAEIVGALDRRFSNIEKIEEALELNLRRCRRLRQSFLKAAFEGSLLGEDASEAKAPTLQSDNPEAVQ